MKELKYRDEQLDDIGMEKDNILIYFKDFLKYKNQQKGVFHIDSITIIGGYSKTGEKEDMYINIRSGEIISIVGPTGSGNLCPDHFFVTN